MKEFFMVALGGIGMLIFAYLVLSHQQASTSILNSGFSGGGTLVKDLQGR